MFSGLIFFPGLVLSVWKASMSKKIQNISWSLDISSEEGERTIKGKWEIPIPYAAKPHEKWDFDLEAKQIGSHNTCMDPSLTDTADVQFICRAKLINMKTGAIIKDYGDEWKWNRAYSCFGYINENMGEEGPIKLP